MSIRSLLGRIQTGSERLVDVLRTSPRFRQRMILAVVLLGTGVLVITTSYYGFSRMCGLIGQYYENDEWAGPPFLTAHDRQIGIHRMNHLDPPRTEDYSIEWTGFLDMPRSGAVQFVLGSDDGSTLHLDNRLVVDNSGKHGYRERTGKIKLSKGLHSITIRYAQAGGEAKFTLAWQPDRLGPRPIPLTALFPEKPSALSYLALRVVTVLFGASVLLGKFVLLISVFMIIVNWRSLGRFLRHSRVGRFIRRVMTWIAEDDGQSPDFSWFPAQCFPLPAMLWGVLLMSFGLNLFGISWGLPGLEGWITDELTPGAIHSAIQHGFSSGWFNKYPPFHFQLLRVLYIPFYYLHHLKMIDLYSMSMYTLLFYIGRFLSVLMGTATVWVVYLCGCEILTKRGAVGAAFITACMPSLVYYAKNVNLDVPYLFWFAWSLYFFLRTVKFHKAQDYIAFALTATLAICTKDQAYGLYLFPALGLVISHYRYTRRQRPYSPKRFADFFPRKMLFALGLAVFVFFLIHNIGGNPQGFLDHLGILLGSGSQPYKMYENTLAGHAAMLWQSLKHLRFSFGWPLFLVCLCGTLRAVFWPSSPRVYWVLLPGISYYVTFISLILYHYVRFFMPICLLLALFGGQCLADFWGSPQRRSPVTMAVVGMLAGYSLLYAASVDILMALDSRYTVETWMETNIEPPALIGMVGFQQYLPRVPRPLQTVQIPYSRFDLKLEAKRPEYLVVNADLQSRNPDFYEHLHKQHLDYRLVYRYRTPVPWLAWINPELAEGGEDDILTSLSKLNPEIQIFQRGIYEPQEQD